MQTALPYLVAIQLLVSLVLAVLLFGIARQVGILHERVAPMGALSSDHGPAVGEAAPVLSVQTLRGARIELGGASPSGRSRLLLFVAPSCPVCKKLLPVAASFSRAERLDILLIGDGEPAELEQMLAQSGVDALPLVNSAQVGMMFQVAKLPYAVLLDGEGVVRAKGLVNNREHLESLIIAEETGFGSIQSYLAAKARAAGSAVSRAEDEARST